MTVNVTSWQKSQRSPAVIQIWLLFRHRRLLPFVWSRWFHYGERKVSYRDDYVRRPVAPHTWWQTDVAIVSPRYMSASVTSDVDTLRLPLRRWFKSLQTKHFKSASIEIQLFSQRVFKSWNVCESENPELYERISSNISRKKAFSIISLESSRKCHWKFRQSPDPQASIAFSFDTECLLPQLSLNGIIFLVRHSQKTIIFFFSRVHPSPRFFVINSQRERNWIL